MNPVNGRPLDKLPPYRCPASAYYSGSHWWQRDAPGSGGRLTCAFCTDTLMGDEIALWRGGLVEHVESREAKRG